MRVYGEWKGRQWEREKEDEAVYRCGRGWHGGLYPHGPESGGMKEILLPPTHFSVGNDVWGVYMYACIYIHTILKTNIYNHYLTGTKITPLTRADVTFPAVRPLWNGGKLLLAV